MTTDQELIQKFESQAGVLLEKAQQYLTTALPGGPGVFAYVVVSSLVGKLFGHTKDYVERAINKPVTLPDFVYVEPLDEELEVFFDDKRFKSLRAEFPEKYEDFTNEDWLKMRRYYKPLYYTFYFKDPFMVQMFSFEIQSQNYKRIIQDFELLPLYKQALNSVPSASRQHALWCAVTSIMKDTVNDVWNKEYAKDLFEEAKGHPEVAELIENIKAKVREKVDIEKLMEWKETIEYITGRSLSPETTKRPEPAMKALEYVTTVLPDGQLTIPKDVVRQLDLKTLAKVRVLLLCEES
ncbi:hypothetical protein GF339_23580 [candidate division KSB3 bacterium]|uniref:Uncharacterized protein n=1 Tax=candidate division KSB3 bacterium TaxID=2044937 RepID=A0A9D5Q840_9BACT|nr:hypothetical protein [candidate division KSB3 bacterium]MBD3327585.1 hypothetical protein [candidate division KSB3 bacterium]